MSFRSSFRFVQLCAALLSNGAPPTLELAGDFADPFVIRTPDAYVALATGTKGAHLQAARSKDLSKWNRLPDPLPVLPKWASNQEALTWAPSVLARGDHYVLYYTTGDTGSGFQCISRAVSPRAEGPFVDESTKPFVCQANNCGSIDPSPFVDTDGTAYLLWKSDENSGRCRTSSRIWTQKLTDDGLDVLGSATALLSTDRGWERPLIEGPSMIRQGDRYLLFYSANWYESPDYAIGYAVCRSPIGDCAKASVDAPWLASDGATLGPGGQELFSDEEGSVWMAYHAWTSPHTTYAAGGARSLRLARLTFAPDGAIVKEPDSERVARTLLSQP